MRLPSSSSCPTPQARRGSAATARASAASRRSGATASTRSRGRTTALAGPCRASPAPRWDLVMVASRVRIGALRNFRVTATRARREVDPGGRAHTPGQIQHQSRTLSNWPQTIESNAAKKRFVSRPYVFESLRQTHTASSVTCGRAQATARGNASAAHAHAREHSRGAKHSSRTATAVGNRKEPPSRARPLLAMAHDTATLLLRVFPRIVM